MVAVRARDFRRSLQLTRTQQRFDTIGALGNEYVSTPNIDRLEAEGVAFTRAYCQAPSARPAGPAFSPALCRARRSRTAQPHYRHDSPPLVARLLADGSTGRLRLRADSTDSGRGLSCHRARLYDGIATGSTATPPGDDLARGTLIADWVNAQGCDLGELALDSRRHPRTDPAPDAPGARKDDEFFATGRPGWPASTSTTRTRPSTRRLSIVPCSIRADMPGPLFRESDLAQQAKLAPLDFQSEGNIPTIWTSRTRSFPCRPVRPGGG